VTHAGLALGADDFRCFFLLMHFVGGILQVSAVICPFFEQFYYFICWKSFITGSAFLHRLKSILFYSKSILLRI